MALDIDHYRTFARYNAWANSRLYDACADLSAEEYHADRPVFFRSIHGTLNHIMVGDRMWVARLDGGMADIKTLDTILYADLAALRAAREADDADLIVRTDRMTNDDLATILSYKTATMGDQTSPVHEMLTHLFNHQTHHRGQVHGCLSQTAVAPPQLDLMYYLRDVN